MPLSITHHLILEAKDSLAIVTSMNESASRPVNVGLDPSFKIINPSESANATSLSLLAFVSQSPQAANRAKNLGSYSQASDAVFQPLEKVPKVSNGWARGNIAARNKHSAIQPGRHKFIVTYHFGYRDPLVENSKCFTSRNQYQQPTTSLVRYTLAVRGDDHFHTVVNYCLSKQVVG